MQRKGYCLAVHKNTCKHTIEYAGAEKQTAKKVDFVIFLSSFFFFLLSHTKLLTSIAYKLKQLLSYFTHRMTYPFHRSSPFQPVSLQTGNSGSFGLLRFCEVLT